MKYVYTYFDYAGWQGRDERGRIAMIAPPPAAEMKDAYQGAGRHYGFPALENSTVTGTEQEKGIKKLPPANRRRV